MIHGSVIGPQPLRRAGLAPLIQDQPASVTCEVIWRIGRKSVSEWSDEQSMSQKPDNQHANSPEPLKSEFAGDGDMVELIQQFLDELPARMTSLRIALETEDEERLRRVAHQLKGAAAGYGFPTITESASIIEQSLLEQEAELSRIEERVEDLLTLCQRAVHGGSDDVGMNE